MLGLTLHNLVISCDMETRERRAWGYGVTPPVDDVHAVPSAILAWVDFTALNAVVSKEWVFIAIVHRQFGDDVGIVNCTPQAVDKLVARLVPEAHLRLAWPQALVQVPTRLGPTLEIHACGRWVWEHLHMCDERHIESACTAIPYIQIPGTSGNSLFVFQTHQRPVLAFRSGCTITHCPLSLSSSGVEAGRQ